MRLVRVGTAVALLLALGGPSPEAVGAALPVLQVDTTVDAVDAEPGDGRCETGAGACSLRAAVQEANALGGVRLVDVPAGAYPLTVEGEFEDEAAAGDLDIGADVILRGAGARRTVLDAPSACSTSYPARGSGCPG